MEGQQTNTKHANEHTEETMQGPAFAVRRLWSAGVTTGKRSALSRIIRDGLSARVVSALRSK